MIVSVIIYGHVSEKMLAIVICKSVSHFAPVIGILFTLFKAFLNQLLDWWSRKLPIFQESKPVFFACFSFPSTFFSRVPTAKKCCTEKAKATMLDVTCGRKIPTSRKSCRQFQVMIFQAAFWVKTASCPLDIKRWTSAWGKRLVEKRETWDDGRKCSDNVGKACNMTGTNKKWKG